MSTTTVAVVFTHLFIRPACTWTISSDGNISVFDSLSGTRLCSSGSSPSVADITRENILKAGAVVSADVDSEGRWLVTAGDDKAVRVWCVEEGGLKVLSEREAPKKPTCLRLTKDGLGQTILVSDKFGDVHSFPLISSLPPPTTTTPTQDQKQQRAPARSHPTLLLGHVSLLPTFLLTPDERYIVTADRDEHVRVSWYPQAYVIERMCTGHARFVSALHIPPSSPSHLLSGGGDPALKIWDWMSGAVVANIHVEDAVKPFIKVLRKRVGKEDGEDEDGGGGGDGGETKGKLGKKLSARQRRRANKRAKKAAEAEKAEEGGDMHVVQEVDEEVDEEADGVAEAMDVDQGSSEQQQDGAPSTQPEASNLTPTKQDIHPLEPLLAIHKIDSICSRVSKRHIVFSAIGATALFAFPYPPCLTSSPSSSSNPPPPSSSTPSDESQPDIFHIDFGKPILDFVRVEEREGEDEVWVLLDVGWNEGEGGSEGSREAKDAGVKMVQVVRVLDGKLILAGGSSIYPWVLKALNSTSLPLASSALPSQDLYSLLSILPKPSHVAQTQSHADAHTDTHPEASSRPDAISVLNEGASRQLSAKEKGRLKSKLAVMAKRAELEGGGGKEQDREIKKVKVDGGEGGQGTPNGS